MLKTKIDNPRYPHRVRITRTVVLNENNPFNVGEDREIVIYDGIGRGYTDTTTVGGNNVDSNKRKAVIPVRFDAWPVEKETFSFEDGTPLVERTTSHVPMSGDKLEVWKGSWYEEQVVRDAEPDNQRTVIYCEFVRN